MDGRFRTADLGRWDAQGRLQVVGRTDDVIVTGGVNVSATRVEQVLADHPGVAACAVVGRPDDEWGQRVVAVVQPSRWDAAPTLEDVRAFAAARLEPAELPRELVALGLLPMLPSGKPDRVAAAAVLGTGGRAR